MVAKLKAIKVELQCHMHDRMAGVGVWLRKVVLSYYQTTLFPGTRFSCASSDFACAAMAECSGLPQSGDGPTATVTPPGLVSRDVLLITKTKSAGDADVGRIAGVLDHSRLG